MNRKLGALAIALAVTACSDDKNPRRDTCELGGPTVTVSCNDGDLCQEMTGGFSAATRQALASGCLGSFAETPCPTEGAVPGRCVYPASLTGCVELREVYYTSSWTLAEAQDWCATPPAGTWQP